MQLGALKKIETGGILVLVSVALFRFARSLKAALANPPWPDVDGYLELSRMMQHPFDTDMREAPWIWFVWLTQRFGTGPLTLGIGGLLLFAITAIFYYDGVKNLSKSTLTAFLATALLLNNGLCLETAAQGVRDILFLLGSLLLIYFTFVEKTNWKPNTRVWGLVLASCIAVGSRITIFPFLIPLLLIAAFRNQKRSLLFYPLAAAFGLMFPYFLYCLSKFGDGFYSANIHAVYWRNLEFLNYNPIGCPTCSEPRTTWFHFIFELHTVKELIYWGSEGFFRLFLKPGNYLRTMSGAFVPLLFPVYYLGLAIVLRSRHRWVFVFPLAYVNVLFYTVHLKMDTRVFTPIIPVLTACLAIGVVYLLQPVLRLAKQRKILAA